MNQQPTTFESQELTHEQLKAKLKETFGYIGLPAALVMFAEILEETREQWRDKDMKAICTRDANTLRNAAKEISKPLTTNK